MRYDRVRGGGRGFRNSGGAWLRAILVEGSATMTQGSGIRNGFSFRVTAFEKEG